MYVIITSIFVNRKRAENMNNLDQWILVVVALAAIVSPPVTAIINNIYFLKLEKIKLEQTRIKENNQYKRNIIHEYLASVGKCSIYPDEEARKLYGEYFPKAYVLIDSDMVKNQMIKINSIINSNDLKPLDTELEHLLFQIENEYGSI